MRYLPVCLWTCLFSTCPALAQDDRPPTEAKKTSIDEKGILALIAQLGDDSSAKRDQAEAKLIALGPPAVAFLRKAAKEDTDAEIRERAANVLSAIRPAPGPGFLFPDANVFDIAFSKDGQSMAVACDDRVIRIYDAKTNALRQVLQGHTATVYALVYPSDGKTLISCSGEYNKAKTPPGEIIVWDLATGTAKETLNGPPGGLCGIALAPDEKHVYACSGGGTIGMWNLAERKELKTIAGHGGKSVRRISLTPDGKLLASAGADGAVRLWDPATLQEVRQVVAHPNGIGAFAFSKDGKLLFTASRAGAPPTPGVIKVWDMETLTEKTTIKGQTQKILSLAVSPDGALLAMSGGLNKGFGEVMIFDLATGAERARFLDHKEWVECVTFSPDGHWMASGGGYTPRSRGELHIWDVKRLVAKGE